MTATGDVATESFTTPLAGPAKSYGAFIAGAEVPEKVGWVNTIHASALIAHTAEALAVQEQMDNLALDAEPPGHPWLVGRTAVVDGETVDTALHAAESAAPRWAAVNPYLRVRLLTRFAEVLPSLKNEFIGMLAAEGHPAALAQWEFEGLRANSQELNVERLKRILFEPVAVEGGTSVLRRQPDGVVVLVPPANATATLAAVAAMIIAAGNAVVVRLPRTNPLGAMWLLQDVLAPLLDEIGAPAGVLNVVCSDDPEHTLERMIAHPATRTMVYFGNTVRGMRIQEQCVEHGVKPVLELAGRDGLVVWRDADLDAAADAVCEAYLGSGQICMLPRCVIVHEAVADDLVARVRERVRSRIRPGVPEDQTAVLAAVVNQAPYFRELERAQRMGAQLVFGGQQIDRWGNPAADGLFVEPALLRVDGLEHVNGALFEQEWFFPGLRMVVAQEPVAESQRHADEMLLGRIIALLNANPYGLRNSLWTSSASVVDEFVRRVVNAGLLLVNYSHVGMPPLVATNGGTGKSGGVWGEGALFAESCTHSQGVYIHGALGAAYTARSAA